MYTRIIRNDLDRSKFISLTLTIFVAAAAMLVSLAAILMIHLIGAIDTMMIRAKTPHFVQMHAGDIDMERLRAFAERHDQVDEFQVLEFLNVDGSKIRFGDRSLATSVQDNGLIIQSEKFDYLLDLDGRVINVSDGELYVPITYMKDHTAKIGDTAVIGDKTFQVAGFLRDSQMNSALASSKRLLISKHDFEELRHLGHIEYLIEFRLQDISKLTEFETAYASAGLEANGPTITYPLFRMINAISDGMMIGVILLITVLVVAITLMCIRFTLLAKIEDDYREIGVMKAIGLRLSDMKKIYIAKYAVIVSAGCIGGCAISWLFKDMLLENIRLYMGESDHASSLALLCGIIGIAIVFITIMVYVGRVLGRLRNISAAEAIRFGASQEIAPRTRRLTLSTNRLLSTNVFLGVRDVLTRTKLYATLLVVLVFSAFMLIVPQNLYNTISSTSFITYMGIGSSDIRIDIQQTDQLPEKVAEVITTMRGDRAITKLAMLVTKTYTAKMEDGSEERLKIEIGDHTIFPVYYSEGRVPVADNELALSTLNARELGKKVGDSLTLMMNGKEKEFIVSGIYPDITNGGKTAKAVFTDETVDMMWCSISATLSDPSLIDRKVSEYADMFAYAKVSDIDEYIAQTFGSTIRAVGKAVDAGIVIALVITALVTLVFIRMLVAKDRYTIAVMRSFGYTNADMKSQYAARSVFVSLIGIVLGTMLANTLGEMLARSLISSLGASTFQFTVDPLRAYLFSPLLMIGTVLIATIIATSGVERLKISDHIKE